MIRQNAIFSGNVQGVGFRYTTRTVAKQLAVTGFVRNLSNGTVEMIAEGESAEIDALISAIEEQMHGYISDVSLKQSDATSEFDGFEIRR